MNNEQLVIKRMLDDKNYEITLQPSEIDTIYRSVEAANVKEDIISRYIDRKEKGTLSACLNPLNLEAEHDLLEYVYYYYHKIHDCNVDYNSIIDAVIGEINEWYSSHKLSALKKGLHEVMEDTTLCERFLCCFERQ